MSKISSPSTPSCPQCGKPLPLTRTIFEYAKAAPYTKRAVSQVPAVNLRAPFCTLRCGWAYGKAQFERKKK